MSMSRACPGHQISGIMNSNPVLNLCLNGDISSLIFCLI